MKKPLPLGPGFLFLAGFIGSSLLAEKIRLNDLPARYKQWLEEEVVYLITPVEKDVFLALQSDRERDLFIKAFWKQRDPTPGTKANEFQEEHYRRLQYVNRIFRTAGKPGWRTDRGKAYIILGEPKDIRVFRGSDAYYPAELWSYQGIKYPGLPPAFYLLFFQKSRVGDFVLYDPAMDGPWSLMPNYEGEIGNYSGVYEVLSDIDPELASASISLIPGESVINAPSLASSMLLRTIDTAAQREVRDLYAQKFLAYKDIVDVEYSTNYLESDHQVAILRDESGIPFVHFSLEPKAINMASFEGTVSTDLELNGIVTDEEGTIIFQFEKTIPLRFTEEQFEKVRQRPFSFTETFPLVPGIYKLSVLLKNTISKEFTSFEEPVVIPESMDRPTMSPLLLAFNSARSSSPQQGPRPFQIGDLLLYSQARRTFLPQDRLHVFFQFSGLSPLDIENGNLRFVFVKEEKEVSSQEFRLAQCARGPNVLAIFSLADFSPGYYTVRVALTDATGKVLVSGKDDFEISPLSYLPRPWVYAKSIVDSDPSTVFLILGRQSMNRGNYPAALPWLTKAHQASPNRLDISISLARAYLQLQRPDDCLRTLEPFSGAETKSQEWLDLVGRAHKDLGNCREAVRYFEEAITSFGLTVETLNLLGECYQTLGNKKQALAAWQKSLEIKPGQEDIQKKIQSLNRQD